MTMPPPTVAVTIGEPAGIGPDLCVRLAEKTWPARLVLIGDIALLRERARRLGAGVRFTPYAKRLPSAADSAALNGCGFALEVAQVPIASTVAPGVLDVKNAKSVMATLEAAIAGCLNGDFAAMVTAPVQKSILNDAGFAFTGHTEYLAAKTATPRVVMMLVGGGLRVALVTTHLPLSSVPAAITRETISETLRIVVTDLKRKFHIDAPRVAVCGLNPHAGESGYLGREEVDIIAPALAALRAEGLTVDGPYPADTIFVPERARAFDAIVAMYHDQGLSVLKYASFGHGVNVTLGLPLVRTSVDHGTALDLAAEPVRARSADPGSLFAAVELAIALANTGVPSH